MSERPIVVLVAGEPVAETRHRRGGYAELIRRAASDFSHVPWVTHDVREAGVVPEPTDALAVIVTGSASSVTEGLPWMQRLSACLRDIVGSRTPLLGICFGHQLLGHALGGRVAVNPRGREMGTVQLDVLCDDPVLGTAGEVPVQATHVDSVVELPPGARVLASTRLEPHAAVKFAPRAWGVQFHPEMDAEVMGHYFRARRSALLAERFDVERAQREVAEAPAGPAIIQRFLWNASRERS